MKGVLESVVAELTEAQQRYPKMASAHEGYAVILEELDELWDEVKKKPGTRNVDLMRHEVIQVAAMALRFAIDVCERSRVQAYGAHTEAMRKWIEFNPQYAYNKEELD